MKSRIFQWTTVLALLAGSVFAAYPYEDSHTIRVDLTLDEHSFKQTEIGGELGFAVPMFTIDQIGLFANYQGYNGQQFKSLGFFIEETYLENKPVRPFLGVGVGYAWVEPKNSDTQKHVYFRVQGGVKVPLNKYTAISAMLSYAASSDDIFLEDKTLTDNIIELRLGMRFYY